MNITKTALALQQAEGVNPEELELINTRSKRPLTAQEVYVFSVRLCDNEVDRDFERFPAQTLEALAPLFLGKSGILTTIGRPEGRPPGSSPPRSFRSRSGSPRQGIPTAG